MCSALPPYRQAGAGAGAPAGKSTVLGINKSRRSPSQMTRVEWGME